MDKIRKDIRIKINLFQQLKIRRNNTEISHNVQYSGRNSQNYLVVIGQPKSKFRLSKKLFGCPIKPAR
jgi:hypothetical protein